MAASIYARAMGRLLGALEARKLRVALWTGEVVGATQFDHLPHHPTQNRTTSRQPCATIENDDRQAAQ